MTIETLKDRIAKAEAKIEKKQGTIARYQKTIANKKAKIAKTTDKYEIEWLEYDIENAQEGISNAEKEIEETTKKLNEYKEALKEEEEKANSRNIQVIIDFLNNWKENVKNFYIASVDRWVETLGDYYKADKEFCNWFNSHWKERNDKELMKKMEEPSKEAKAIHSQYNYLDRYMEWKGGKYVLNMELLQKDLDVEADRKYDFIIERTNKIVGQITDAGNLRVGEKGDLNGFIIGTRGKAKVQTIDAGGWNIQCYHFRTLINEVR